MTKEIWNNDWNWIISGEGNGNLHDTCSKWNENAEPAHKDSLPLFHRPGPTTSFSQEIFLISMISTLWYNENTLSTYHRSRNLRPSLSASEKNQIAYKFLKIPPHLKNKWNLSIAARVRPDIPALEVVIARAVHVASEQFDHVVVGGSLLPCSHHCLG